MLVVDQLQKNDTTLRVLAWVVAAGLLVLLAGLYYVQVVSAARYRAEQNNQSFRTVRLPATRGVITDHHGHLLAENRPSYHISLYLEEPAIRDRFKARYRELKGNQRLTRDQQAALARRSRYEVVSNLVQEVNQVLRDPATLTEAQFTRHYERSLALPLPVAANVDATNLARFAESTRVPPGFDLEVRPMRHYPYRSTACHVLGFLVRDEGSQDEDDFFYNYRLPDYTGVAGIEGFFNSDLKGRAGAKSVRVNNLGYRQAENVWSPVTPGYNLRLTLDVGLQRTAEYALSRALNNTRGAAVVLDAGNGDVLVMASAPSYNPNDFIPYMPTNIWAQLNDEALRPLANRAIYGSYPPGSIFKIVVGLAALEAGLNPTNIITSPGYATVGVGNRPIDDTAPAGDYDFKRALKLSCNKYFVDVGVWAGLDRIVAMARQFHLGERTGIHLRPESAGVLPTREWIRENRGAWFDGDTANLSIGQGDVTVTPLQVALMVAAIANGGSYFWPRLVERIDPQEGRTDESSRYYPPGRVRSRVGVSARSLEIMRQAMLADVEDADGTGRLASVPGFRIAAKTGTAEIKKGRTVVDKITWFASFGPYENPRYVVVVMVESGVSGGRTCGPVAREIYKAITEREKGSPGAAAPNLARN